MDLRMERFLREHKQLPSAAPKILEINPEHPIIHTMMDRLADPASADYIRDLCWLLLDQANIQEGEPIADPSAFSRRLSQFLIMANK